MVLVNVSIKLLDGSNYSEKISTDTFGEWSIGAPLGTVLLPSYLKIL